MTFSKARSELKKLYVDLCVVSEILVNTDDKQPVFEELQVAETRIMSLEAALDELEWLINSK